jgi:hypothetical protein
MTQAEEPSSVLARAKAQLSAAGVSRIAIASVSFFAGAFQIARSFPEIASAFASLFHWLGSAFSTPAHAQAMGTQQRGAPTVAIHDPVFYILIAGVFLVLIGCFWFVLFSGKPKGETERAWDLIKIICGFFIGTLAKGV